MGSSIELVDTDLDGSIGSNWRVTEWPAYGPGGNRGSPGTIADATPTATATPQDQHQGDIDGNGVLDSVDLFYFSIFWEQDLTAISLTVYVDQENFFIMKPGKSSCK